MHMIKYTLITGAAGGLGRAFTMECVRRGQNILITDVSQKNLMILVNYIKIISQVDVKFFVCDLTDMQERKKLFDYIIDNNVQISTAINVAGVDFEGLIETVSSEKISTICRLNLEAGYDINRFMISGSSKEPIYIINTASLGGFYPMPFKAIYSASKSAVIQYSLALREEIKSRGNILALCPAGLRTTPELCKKIDSQGFMGKITTIDTGKVAKKALNRVYQGRAVFIPGYINKVMLLLSSLMPNTLKAKIIYRRWSKRKVSI